MTGEGVEVHIKWACDDLIALQFETADSNLQGKELGCTLSNLPISDLHLINNNVDTESSIELRNMGEAVMPVISKSMETRSALASVSRIMGYNSDQLDRVIFIE